MFEKGFERAAAELVQEAALIRDARTVGLLERKWTSVIRLQKKIADMEQRYGKPRAEPLVVGLFKDIVRFQGHSGPINKVAFHPNDLIIATASEDATIRLWDLETGRLERVLKKDPCRMSFLTSLGQ